MLQNLKNITTFIFDVDGVLTDGTIIASESGALLRSFNIKDGYALQLAVKKGYHVCIISIIVNTFSLDILSSKH